jgi:acetyl-CoA carboxylase biotin carboxylase subunit
MFSKVLVANRGEVAVRIIRACQELGLATVIAHSDTDRDSLGVLLADESVCIGPAASDKSYLNIANIVSAAQITHADALHPGYGFLAENAYLAEICEAVGITFIGPRPRSIAEFSDKVAARSRMQQAGVPIVPGSNEPLISVDAAVSAARGVGYPVLLKAVAGGGGRGMRVARDATELARLFPVAQTEAQAHFANGALYLEHVVPRGRHIEVQVAADRFGKTIHLGERECSIQRRHQKLVEESPAPALAPERRAEISRMARLGMEASGYQNIGTVEFLVDQQADFYFIEANTRLQVEHPVTELVTGIDLVKLQIELAAGLPLPLAQADVRLSGHALECRVTAEDPAHAFAPDSGHIPMVHLPGGPWVRVDTHLYSGYTTPPYYDSLLAKIITWGRDRAESFARMRRALSETRIEGVKTNLAYLSLVLSDPRFCEGTVDVEFVERHLAELHARGNDPAALTAE